MRFIIIEQEYQSPYIFVLLEKILVYSYNYTDRGLSKITVAITFICNHFGVRERIDRYIERCNTVDIVLGLLLTAAYYAIIPIGYAAIARQNVSKKKYLTVVIIGNLIAAIIAEYLTREMPGGATFMPAFLWTSILFPIGKKILRNKGLYNDQGNPQVTQISDNSVNEELTVGVLKPTMPIESETSSNQIKRSKPVESENSKNEDFLYCYKCGNKLVEGSNYCSKCGTPVPH